MDAEVDFHPAFARHFRHPLYRDDADELAPFGSDEGADALRTWAGRRSELGPTTTLRSMLSADVDDVDALLESLRIANPPQVDVESVVIGTGFALLALTGHLDPEGSTLVMESLNRTAAFYADVFGGYRDQMASDLRSYRGDSTKALGAAIDRPSTDRAGLFAGRPSWISVLTFTGDHGFNDVTNRRQFVRRHRAGYKQKMAWLLDQLNGGRTGHSLIVTPWSQWWDQQDTFIGVYVSVDYRIGTTPVFRYRTNRSPTGAADLMVSTVLDLDGIADTSVSGPGSGANLHLSEILAAIGARSGLGPCPPLPRTKKELGAGA